MSAAPPSPPSGSPARRAESACVFCDRVGNRGLLERRQVYEDDAFLVVHQLNEEGPLTYLGNLQVQTKRHARNLSELSEPEASQLGRLLSRLTRVLIECTKAEWAYCFSFTEGFRHVHFILAARYPGLPKDFHRLEFANWPEAPRGAPAQVEELCRLMREKLETPGGRQV